MFPEDDTKLLRTLLMEMEAEPGIESESGSESESKSRSKYTTLMTNAVQHGAINCLKLLAEHIPVCLQLLKTAVNVHANRDVIHWILSELKVDVKTAVKTCTNEIHNVLEYYRPADCVVDLRGLEPMIIGSVTLEQIAAFFDWGEHICINITALLFFSVMYEKYTLFNFLIDKVSYREQLETEIVIGHYHGTILSACVKRCYIHGLGVLFNRGCDFNKVTSSHDGNITLLMEASVLWHGEKSSELIRTLIEYGCNPFYFNESGVSCMVIAVSNHNIDLISLLEEYEPQTQGWEV